MEPVLPPVPRYWAFASPFLSKRATLKAPRRVYWTYTDAGHTRRQEPMRAYNTPLWGVPVALSLTGKQKLRSSVTSKPKRKGTPLYMVDTCLPPFGAFSKYSDPAKIHIFPWKPCKMNRKKDSPKHKKYYLSVKPPWKWAFNEQAESPTGTPSSVLPEQNWTLYGGKVSTIRGRNEHYTGAKWTHGKSKHCCTADLHAIWNQKKGELSSWINILRRFLFRVLSTLIIFAPATQCRKRRQLLHYKTNTHHERHTKEDTLHNLFKFDAHGHGRSKSGLCAYLTLRPRRPGNGPFIDTSECSEWYKT